MTSIGDWAFFGCTKLTGIIIPKSVSHIGFSVFDYTELTYRPKPLSIAIHAPGGSYAAEFFKDDPRLVVDG